MIGLALVLLVVVVIVTLARRAPGAHPDPVAGALRRAAAAGIISDQQVDAVLAAERRPAAHEPRPAPGVPPVLEALGYLGAILAIAGAMTLVAQFWDDLATGGRLLVLGITAVTLTVAGLAIRDEDEPVLWRLRGVVLLLATGALAGFTGVLMLDTLDVGHGGGAALAIGAAVAVHAGALWQLDDRPAQHAACLGGLVAATAGAIAWAGGDGGAIGTALWVLAAAWLVAALARRLPPALVGMALGAALLLVAAGVTGAEWHRVAPVFGLATAAGLVAIGIRRDEFVVTGVGVIGAFVYLPMTVATFFAGTVGVPVVMLVSGLCVLGLAVFLLRRGAGGLGGGLANGWPNHA